MHLDALFSQFIREKQFLGNISPRTVKSITDCQRAYKRTLGDTLPTKENLKEFVMKLQDSGISVSTVNFYIRTLNSFLSWMFENDMLTERLRVKRLKEPERALKTFTNEQLRLLLSWKPKNFFEHRIYTMICLAIDTGVRIDEIITLTRDRLNLEQLMITVKGKGNKERILPISNECKKVLQRFLRKHEFNVVFPTRQGAKLYLPRISESLFSMLFTDFVGYCKEIHLRIIGCHDSIEIPSNTVESFICKVFGIAIAPN